MVNLSKQKFVVGAIQLTAPAAAMMLDKTFGRNCVHQNRTYSNNKNQYKGGNYCNLARNLRGGI